MHSTQKAPISDSSDSHSFNDEANHGTLSGGNSAPAQAQAPPRIITVQPLSRSDMQTSYAQDMGTGSLDHDCYGSVVNFCGVIVGNCGTIPCCPAPNIYKVRSSPARQVGQGSVGLITRFGQFYKSVDPGLVKVNPFTERLRIVDVKIQSIPIPRQNVTTRDNVSVDLDSVMFYHIVSPFRAVFGIADVRNALMERAQTTLRHVIGSRTLQSLLTDREAVASEIESIVEGVAEAWGVKVESILIKDILFSAELQASLSSAAQAKRVGEAKIIAARAEVDSAKLMREAADILSSPAAIQIRQLEALQQMARSSQAKTIFVPMNLFGNGAADVGSVAGPSSLNNTAMINQLADS
ncbi:BQ2448_3930 [Microbotryum intermedium]|uniref:BQ2448_3930 protein n=1 Tax=Microbotryum intermedium TaxID=269621 RepID=A0A238FK63_9BASI|nr:BQ2448_3930 [Microbotryum intermedium]